MNTHSADTHHKLKIEMNPLCVAVAVVAHWPRSSAPHARTDSLVYFLVAMTARTAVNGFVGQTTGSNHNKRDRVGGGGRLITFAHIFFLMH